MPGKDFTPAKRWRTWDDVPNVKLESLKGLGITKEEDFKTFVSTNIDPFNVLCRRKYLGKITVQHLYRVTGLPVPTLTEATRIMVDGNGDQFEVKHIKANLYTVINLKRLEFNKKR